MDLPEKEGEQVVDSPRVLSIVVNSGPFFPIVANSTRFSSFTLSLSLITLRLMSVDICDDDDGDVDMIDNSISSTEDDDSIARRRDCTLTSSLVVNGKKFTISTSCSSRPSAIYFNPRAINKSVCLAMGCGKQPCSNCMRAAVSGRDLKSMKTKGFLVLKSDIEPVDSAAWPEATNSYYLAPGHDAAQACLDAILRRHIRVQARRTHSKEKKKKRTRVEEDAEHETGSSSSFPKGKKQALETQLSEVLERMAQLESQLAGRRQ